jgi:hypothetical protein
MRFGLVLESVDAVAEFAQEVSAERHEGPEGKLRESGCVSAWADGRTRLLKGGQESYHWDHVLLDFCGKGHEAQESAEV